ncbi:MAG TPA: flagellar biosynthesis protein FlhB [Firmicutes bacterium]|nr:flagellar biosynthesis protein FlhB [Candidatus Fermentithermobacillaceae bacterium]
MTLYREVDLQLFAEEKSQPATPRRRQLARERGQVFSSQDLTSAVSILFAVLTLKFTLKFSAGVVAQKSSQIWASMPSGAPGIGWAANAMKDVMATFFLAGFPVMAAAVVFGVGTSLLQVGFMAKPGLLLPDVNRLNPLEGFKRIFSRRSLQALFKSLAKTLLIGLVAWNTAKSVWPQLSALVITDLAQSVSIVAQSVSNILVNSSILLIFIGVLDYVYQWWEYEKSLRMTYQEVKEEIKDTEGKPEVRQAIRQRQRQISMRRMMQDVPSADVVLINPTHYAVALKYSMEEDAAPKVVAKGLNELALRIRAIAEENRVYVFEDPPLAQALYHAVDIGEMIPEELYQAVAQVLAYVYRLSGMMPMEGT